MSHQCLILFVSGKEMHLARKNFWILAMCLILFHSIIAAVILTLIITSRGFCQNANIHIIRIIESCSKCSAKVNNLSQSCKMVLPDIKMEYNEFNLQFIRNVQGEAIDLFPYSAYFDDRQDTSGARGTSVRILAMCRRTQLSLINKINCMLWTGNHSHPPHLTIAKYDVIWESPAEFQAILITCDIPDDLAMVQNVSLIDGDCHLPRNLMAVTHSFFSNRSTENIGLCNKVMYSAPDAVRFVEWLELNRLFGIDKVYIYNTTVLGRSNDVINLYSKQGTITLRQHGYLDSVSKTITQSPFPSPDYNQNWQLEVMSLTDCIYSSSERYLVVIDLDEILYPTSGNFMSLLKNVGFTLHNKSAALTFFTTIFSDEFGADEEAAAPWYLHTIKFRKRTRLDWESPKSIVDALRCKGLGHHVCLKPLDGYNCRSNLEPTVGYVRHYRKTCRLTEPGKCSKLLKRSFIDKSLDPYASNLSLAVKKKLESLDLL